jgi:hypothetical protein
VSNDHFCLDDDGGLVPFSDEADSESEGQPPPAAGFQTVVWKPKNGLVEMVKPEFVRAVSDRTGGTSFSVNFHRNEILLHGGDVAAAISLLNALESTLVSTRRYSSRLSF